MKRWKKKKKKFKAQRVKPCTSILVMDVLIGDEEQTGKEKEERIRDQFYDPATLNPSVPSYDLHGI